MTRVWFLTWTTYGTWLPGDDRGFVSNIAGEDGHGVRLNAPRSECAAELPALRTFHTDRLRAEPVFLTADHAAVLLTQFRETAAYRRWSLMAAAVMWNHAHLLVAVPGDPVPDSLLRDFKSYGSRALNRRWPMPASGTWWTEGGSTRKKADAAGVRGAVEYVRGQPNPLVVWVDEDAVHRTTGERPA